MDNVVDVAQILSTIRHTAHPDPSGKPYYSVIEDTLWRVFLGADYNCR